MTHMENINQNWPKADTDIRIRKQKHETDIMIIFPGFKGLNRVMKYILKIQIKLLEVKTTMFEVKNTWDQFGLQTD